MLNLSVFQQDTLVIDVNADQVDCLLKKGQRIVYEGEEAKIINTKPLLVIKTKNRVICGALQREIEYVRRQNTHW